MLEELNITCVLYQVIWIADLPVFSLAIPQELGSSFCQECAQDSQSTCLLQEEEAVAEMQGVIAVSPMSSHHPDQWQTYQDPTWCIVWSWKKEMKKVEKKIANRPIHY